MKKIIVFIALIAVVAIIYLRWTKSESSDTIELKGVTENMQITSPVFENMGRIPDEYTCQGDDTNPPLEFSQIPEGAQSLVLIVEDPDAPSGTWDHWILFNINTQTTAIAPNSVPSAAYQVFNSFGRIEYGGPCPPEGEEHRYYFKLYALDQLLATDGTIVDKPSLITAMNGHILAQGELVGLYSRD